MAVTGDGFMKPLIDPDAGSFQGSTACAWSDAHFDGGGGGGSQPNCSIMPNRSMFTLIS
jgi:hypothetical protein